MTAQKNPVLDAIRSRRSIRAFRPDPVPEAVIREILAVAAQAPSGSNIQPWKVAVVTGEALAALGAELSARVLAGNVEGRAYHYYPQNWREPYLARRRATGWGLYGALGITRDDKQRMAEQHARNYRFFDAPAGLFFLLDKDMEIGSWLDLGMFVQNVMIAARAHGLETCPQAAFADFPTLIPQRLGLPDDLQLICGMALGLPDLSAPENSFSPGRVPPEDFTWFVDRLPSQAKVPADSARG